jgi:hypothetical protein
MKVWTDWLQGMLVGDGGLQEQSDLPNLQDENDALRKEIAHMYMSHTAECDALKVRAYLAEEIARRAQERLAVCLTKVEFAMAHLSKAAATEAANANS